MQRGRKSAAALSVVPGVVRIDRLRAPRGLTEVEDALFRKIVAQCSADHFVPSDASLLVAYTQAVLLSRWAFKQVTENGTAFQTWQQAARTLASLAVKLRLCPHSRSDPKTVARHSRGVGVSAYDLMRMNEDD